MIENNLQININLEFQQIWYNAYEVLVFRIISHKFSKQKFNVFQNPNRNYCSIFSCDFSFASRAASLNSWNFSANWIYKDYIH